MTGPTLHDGEHDDHINHPHMGDKCLLAQVPMSEPPRGWVVIPVDGDNLAETFKVVRDALHAHWVKTGEQAHGPVYATFDQEEYRAINAIVQAGQ